MSTPSIPPVGETTTGPSRPRRPWIVPVLATAVTAMIVAIVVLFAVGNRVAVEPLDAALTCRQEDPGDATARRAQQRLEALRPKGMYVVIDSYRNRLQVFDGPELLRDAVCSTGSGTVLVHPSGKRSWTFDTPLGERHVIRKVRNPIWTKPDWAFIEEGFQPPKDPSLRIDRVSLGDYALYLGDGYIIHGTLFQTLLGQGVTHGCVRLGDEDLEYVYRAIPVGARVFLH